MNNYENINFHKFILIKIHKQHFVAELSEGVSRELHHKTPLLSIREVLAIQLLFCSTHFTQDSNNKIVHKYVLSRI